MKPLESRRANLDERHGVIHALAFRSRRGGTLDTPPTLNHDRAEDGWNCAWSRAI